MAQLATVSSKGQLIIPGVLRKKYKIKGGAKIAVGERGREITHTPNPCDALLASRGCLSHVAENIETWLMEEKREEREREDAKAEELL